MDHDKLLVALEAARKAAQCGEVPIGAVVAQGDTVISVAHNRIEELKDPTAHAEVLAIRDAAAKLGRWRLNGCALFVTLEPCAMCLAAARFARVDRIIYGAGDSRFGAIESQRDWSRDPELGPVPDVISGVLRDECADLLKAFFKGRR